MLENFTLDMVLFTIDGRNTPAIIWFRHCKEWNLKKALQKRLN